MKRIGVGVIGAGAIAENAHLPAYSQMPEARLVAIAEINVERCKIVASRFNVPKWYDDYQKLLEDKDIQAVSVCTPPDTHTQICVAAAEAGKHILCEKPMALKVEDSDKMIHAAERNDVKLMVGHAHRYAENFRMVRRLVTKGAVGDVVLARLEMFSGGPIAWPAVSKYFIKRESGGGVLINVGTHTIDLLRWVVGDEVKRVCGLVGTYGVVPEMIENQIDDKALALLEFERGVFGEICVSYMPASFENALEICGTKGKIITERPPPLVLSPKRAIRHYRGDRGPYRISVHQPRSEIYLEINDFINCIRKNKKPRVSGYDGRIAVQIALAIYESYAEKTWKEI